MGTDKSPFAQHLGAKFDALPDPLQRFHSVMTQQRFSGRVSVEHGAGVFTRAAILSAGFPSASRDIPFQIVVTKRPGGEEWVRHFGRKRTRSFLSVRARDHALMERFGPVTCHLSLDVHAQTLHVNVVKTMFLGLPLPRILSPQSASTEAQDGENRLGFDIKAYWPNNRLIIRYSGYLDVGRS